MPDFRYAQFCPIARAAEILGQRWTLLILRNLAFSPQRFSDLRRGLAGVSASVLCERLEQLEAHQLVRRRSLPPPTGATVYELGPAGLALGPAMMELARWGRRFLGPPEPGDQIEPYWVRAAMGMFARRDATPAVQIVVKLSDEDTANPICVRGGEAGTTVAEGDEDGADAIVEGACADLFSALLGHFAIDEAIADGRLRVTGDPRGAARLPELFDLDRSDLRLDSPTPKPEGN